MAIPREPNEDLALKALPEPLRKAIQATFKHGLPGCALVGGTALAGFYACHRESDDMDLFTADATAQAMTVAAVKALKKIGATLSDERNSPNFYHTLATLSGRNFTVDVVLDSNIHKIGTFAQSKTGVRIASLETLLMMKIAALVSRCSEKDLYDLIWLTEHYRHPDIEEWVALGRQVDGGSDAESMLISLTGANLRMEACGFAAKFGGVPAEVFKSVSGFRNSLQKKLAIHLEKTPPQAAIAPLLKEIRRLRRKDK